MKSSKSLQPFIQQGNINTCNERVYKINRSQLNALLLLEQAKTEAEIDKSTERCRHMLKCSNTTCYKANLQPKVWDLHAMNFTLEIVLTLCFVFCEHVLYNISAVLSEDSSHQSTTITSLYSTLFSSSKQTYT
jgi:hypothetical protein